MKSQTHTTFGRMRSRIKNIIGLVVSFADAENYHVIVETTEFWVKTVNISTPANTVKVEWWPNDYPCWREDRKKYKDMYLERWEQIAKKYPQINRRRKRNHDKTTDK